MTLLTVAQTWQFNGASVIPVTGDGSKRPPFSWKQYQTRPAEPAAIAGWFGGTDPTYPGVGVICGQVSGQLEMLELEGRAVEERVNVKLLGLIQAHGLGDLWSRITDGYLERTPTGGLHWLYRVSDAPARGNTKLARRPATPAELAAEPLDKIRVLIETRGEGGFTVVAPSAGRTHTTGKPWAMISGSVSTVATITGEERDALYGVCTLLDAMPAVGVSGPSTPTPPGYTAGTRPGDDYNNRADWVDILTGWTRMWPIGRGFGWRRPGKNDRSISATTGQAADGVDRLYVFSSSTDFDPEVPYSKFGAYTHLNHGDDYRAAAKALAALGYGEPAKQTVPILDLGHSQRNGAAPPTAPAAAIPTAPRASSNPRLSDNGNALALVSEHGADIRYCTDRGRWLVWDSTRWHWQPGSGGDARELAKHVAQHMPVDPKDKAAAAWQTRSLSANGTTSTLVQAQTDTRITVTLAQLDADPYALGTPEGVVDLRTGGITPPDPATLTTRSAPCTPDDTADRSAWLAFLAVTFGNDQELIGYLQRLIGYSATGAVGPHVLPFCHGSGGNGKGVFLNTIAQVLGDYAIAAPNAFLMAKTFAVHDTEIARLSGARMVICAEVNEADRFDEAKVKQLTGGDMLSGRFMRQDYFNFTPTHHLWLVGNYRPAVTSGGRSFWRRCRLIPFLHDVPEPAMVDDLQGKLAREHGPAILSWIVDGAAQYAASGLAEPESVKAATAEYAAEQDTVGRFVDDECHIARGQAAVRITTREMVGAYDRWCADNGEHPVTSKRFGIDLRNRFDVGVYRSNGQKFYTGIALIGQITYESSTGAEGWYR